MPLGSFPVPPTAPSPSAGPHGPLPVLPVPLVFLQGLPVSLPVPLVLSVLLPVLQIPFLALLVTESQNHRMFRVGRDLCGSPSPTLLPKQGHPEQTAQHRIQAGLEYVQRRRLHSLPGQPGPGLRHPQREEVLPRVQLELSLLHFVPTASCPVTGHHCKESGPVFPTPTLQIFRGISKVPSQPSLLQAEQAQLPQPLLVGEMLQSPHHPCSPPLDSLQ